MILNFSDLFKNSKNKTKVEAIGFDHIKKNFSVD